MEIKIITSKLKREKLWLKAKEVNAFAINHRGSKTKINKKYK
jgi:hypothetical protein